MMKEPFILNNNSSKRIGFLITFQKDLEKMELGFIPSRSNKSFRTSNNLGKVFIITQKNNLLI